MRKLLLAARSDARLRHRGSARFVSSHREAPGIALDPSADNTDTYAWTAARRARRADRRGGLDSGRGAGERAELPLVRRPRPLLHPRRQHGRRPARRQLPVQLQDEGPEQELVPVRAPGRERVRRSEAERDPALLGRARDASLPPRARPREEKTLARGLPVAPPNIGPKTFPNYDNFVNGAIRSLRRRHEGVRRPARRSVLRRPRRDVRRHQPPQAHRQPGRGQGRPERIQRPLGRHAAARAAGDPGRQGRLRARTRGTRSWACGPPPSGAGSR